MSGPAPRREPAPDMRCAHPPSFATTWIERPYGRQRAAAASAAVRTAPSGQRRQDRAVRTAPSGQRRQDSAVRTAPSGQRSHHERASHHAVFAEVSVPRVVGGLPVRPVFAEATRKLLDMPALANAPPIWLLPRAKFGSVVPLA